MSDAIIGVIVGWGLTAGTGVAGWLWRSRQRDAEQKTALRRAARMILEDLLVAERATRPRERGEVNPFEFDFFARKLPTNTWNQNRETLSVAPCPARLRLDRYGQAGAPSSALSGSTSPCSPPLGTAPSM
jgi:hypothetical protein